MAGPPWRKLAEVLLFRHRSTLDDLSKIIGGDIELDIRTVENVGDHFARLGRRAMAVMKCDDPLCSTKRTGRLIGWRLFIRFSPRERLNASFIGPAGSKSMQSARFLKSVPNSLQKNAVLLWGISHDSAGRPWISPE
jgi:hypothetical protein